MEDYINEDWHHELKRVAKKLSQSQIAARLDCSGALVSQVLNGKYAEHRVATFREKFEGAFQPSHNVAKNPFHRCQICHSQYGTQYSPCHNPVRHA